MFNCLIVYHFFAHYRRPVMESLILSKENHYDLVGDECLPDGSIKSWVPSDKDRFVVSKCRQLGPLMFQQGLVKQAVRRDVDCIIYLGNYQWPMTWLSALMARMTGKRVLFWTHGWIQRERGLKQLIRNTFYKLAHGLLLYGNAAKEIGISSGFSPENLYVIYNSLDYDNQVRVRSETTSVRLAEVQKALFGESRLPIVVCPSRLTKVRELDLLLDAVSLMKSDGIEVNVLLIGAGPEEEPLRNMAADLELNVHFYGACYEEDALGEMMMASSVTVAPGKVGLTAMHSLVYGTPVITHNDVDNQMPEWEAIEAGKSGAFFERGNAESLAKTITQIISEPQSKESRRSCMAVIDQFYNPTYQVEEINRAVAGMSPR